MNNDELRKKWLRQTTDTFSIVLNDNELELFKSSKHILNQFMTNLDYCPQFICLCKHDKDFDDIEQRMETPHYQCLIQFKESHSFGTIIKLIQLLFPLVNENQIGLEKVADIGKMARYVLHRGWYEKYQYPLSELETNDIDTYMLYYNMVEIKSQIDCVTVVKNYNYNLESIITHVSNYHSWRSIIKDLITDNRMKGRY